MNEAWNWKAHPRLSLVGVDGITSAYLHSGFCPTRFCGTRTWFPHNPRNAETSVVQVFSFDSPVLVMLMQLMRVIRAVTSAV